MGKNKKNKGRISGHFFAVLAVAIWSAALVTTKNLLEYCTVTQLIAIYLIPAYLVLFLLSPRFMKLGGVGSELRYAIMGVTGFIGTYYLFGLGYTREGAELVETAICCIPLTVSIALCVSGRRDKITLLQAAGLIIAFIGGVMTITAPGGSVVTSVGSGTVIILAGACFCRGVYSALLDMTRTERVVASARRTVFWAMLTALVMMFLTDGLPTFEPLLRASNIIYIIIGGAGGCGIAYAMWHASSMRIGAERSANYMYLIPIAQLAFTTFTAGGGDIQMTALAGAVVSLIGIILSAMAG